MYKLVIFDCDGVLVDSEPLSIRADVEMLASLGWPMSEAEVVHRFLGRTSRAMEAEIEAHIGGAIPEETHRRWRERFDGLLDNELTPVDGIVEALDRIATPTCVASSGGHDKMRRTLGLTGLWDRFEGRIFSASEVGHGKPAPDLFLHAAATMGVDPADCAVIEDSHYGVEAARAAGMTAFAYAGGLAPPERLAGPNTVLFTDMRDLSRLLGEADAGAGRKERSAALVVRGHRVLLMGRHRDGRDYLTVPGGKIEAGETPAEAALRELEEETGLTGEHIGEPFCVLDSRGRTEHFYLVDAPTGTPALGGPELERRTSTNWYEPVWLDFDELAGSTLVPEVIRALLAARLPLTGTPHAPGNEPSG